MKFILSTLIGAAMFANYVNASTITGGTAQVDFGTGQIGTTEFKKGGQLQARTHGRGQGQGKNIENEQESRNDDDSQSGNARGHGLQAGRHGGDGSQGREFGLSHKQEHGRKQGQDDDDNRGRQTWQGHGEGNDNGAFKAGFKAGEGRQGWIHRQGQGEGKDNGRPQWQGRGNQGQGKQASQWAHHQGQRERNSNSEGFKGGFKAGEGRQGWVHRRGQGNDQPRGTIGTNDQPLAGSSPNVGDIQD